MIYLALVLLGLVLSACGQSDIDNSNSENQKISKILPRKVRDLEEQYGSFEERFTKLEERFTTECTDFDQKLDDMNSKLTGLDEKVERIVACPDGYTEDQYKQLCFQLFPGVKAEFQNAKKVCSLASPHGRLIVLNTMEKFDFIRQKAQEEHASLYWVGLERDVHAAMDHWLDGSVVGDKSAMFYAGEPNNYGGFEGCAVMVEGEFFMNDDSCNKEFPFICEVPMN